MGLNAHGRLAGTYVNMQNTRRREASFSSNATQATRSYVRPSIACVSCVLACRLLRVACVPSAVRCMRCVAWKPTALDKEAVNYRNNPK